MAYAPSPAQIEWHMHLLRQWMSPNSSTNLPDAKQDYTSCPQEYDVSNIPPYCQHDFDTYSVQSEPELYPQLRRAQTTTCFPEFTYGDFSPPLMTSLSCSGGDFAGVDDVLSCYSDAPSTYISSEYSDSMSLDGLASTPTSSTYSSSLPTTKRPSVDPSSHHVQREQSYQPEVQPATEIDALMLALQPSDSQSSTTTSLAPPTSLSFSGKPKKHLCPHPNCTKSFTQLTHLRIHHRCHTGEKPYTCSIPSCGQSFSQLGNLRTHERRHAGQRPNRKTRERASSDPGFPTSSPAPNPSAIKYSCRLDACNGKPFTQLGNLKSHQNKFHADTLRDLCVRFASGDCGVGDHDVQLMDYFRDLYKNSNKGIKGRGKGRRVEVVTALSPDEQR